MILGRSSAGGTECLGIIITPYVKPLLGRVLPSWSEKEILSRIMTVSAYLFNAIVTALTGVVYGMVNLLLCILT